jgi:hypothetical protein
MLNGRVLFALLPPLSKRHWLEKKSIDHNQICFRTGVLLYFIRQKNNWNKFCILKNCYFLKKDLPKNAINERRSAINERRSTISERRSTINERRSTINERRSTINERRSTINERRSTINERRSTINERRSVINEHRKSTNETKKIY